WFVLNVPRGLAVLGALTVLSILGAGSVFLIRQASPSLGSGPGAGEPAQLAATSGLVTAPPAREWPPLGSYTVEDGDSLLGIGAAANSWLDVLQLANGLEDADLIQVGQVLRLPPPGTSAQRADSAASLTQIALERGV